MKATKSRVRLVAPWGFTLVELLVVIGIIALLIAILLPSLANARRSAQRTACAVKLQQMMVAANVHAANHKGYFPLCGVLGDVDPWGLRDTNQQYYDYIQYTGLTNATTVLAPITFALAKEMSYKGILDASDNASIAKIENDPTGMIKNFMCPSQGIAPSDLNYTTLPYLHYGGFSQQGSAPMSGGSIYDQEAQSYIFNEQVLGVDDTMGRLRGKASAVRQASKVMFAADGLASSTTARASSSVGSVGIPMMTLYCNTYRPGVTMGDALQGRKVAGQFIAGDPVCFDNLRHRGKINVAFCDGHVETRNVTLQDLQGIYLQAP